MTRGSWGADEVEQLETDPNILLYKCRQALERYRHHLVIGNLLSTRKFEVVFVDKDGEQWIRVPEAKDGEEQIEIESLIIPEVVKRHEITIGAKKARPKTAEFEKEALGQQGLVEQ
jgi:phosphopantothenate-cysteine ligase